jgi:hypothetical protein
MNNDFLDNSRLNSNRLSKMRLLVSTLALLSSVATASDDHDDHHSSHGAHVHGEATLTMALEGSDVEISLESPAANIIGFEYKASTEEEKRIEVQAARALKSATMFSFAGATCELEKVVVVLPDAHKERHAEHSEVTANYHYRCENLNKLQQVATDLFKEFPKLEKVDAMWVSASGQGAEELSAKKPVMRIR